jgi:hypothetical protein
MTRNKNFCLLLFLLLIAGSAKPMTAAKRVTPVRVSGCEVLEHPGRYTNKMVRIRGLLNIGFERSDLTFECPGKIMITFSLYEPDKKKFGFLTDEQVQKDIAKRFPEPHPGDNLSARERRTAPVEVTGFFRCHYDFPDCKDVSRDGDSSIDVRSMSFTK